MNKYFLLLLVLVVIPQAFAEHYSCVAICMQKSSASEGVNWYIRLPNIVIDSLATADKVLLNACEKQNGNAIVSFLETATVNDGNYGVREEKIILERPFDTSLCQKFDKDQARILPNQFPKTVEAIAEPDHE